jgi:hypothetical protein
MAWGIPGSLWCLMVITARGPSGQSLQLTVAAVWGTTASPVEAREVVAAVSTTAWWRGSDREQICLLSIQAPLCLLSLAPPLIDRFSSLAGEGQGHGWLAVVA